MPNALIHESSPYLLQHAHNPVNWYPWGAEALERAVAEDKIILVSIGYAACHWCHVMERESFEDEATAELMNANFINIKIDREERPDLDHIYMDAVQAMTGSGGWPLNVFLTPDKRPFFGGTYFPPVRAHGRSSWKDVLTSVADAYKTRRDEITGQADYLVAHLSKANRFGHAEPGETEALFSENALEQITRNLLANADTEWGGFGRAPKFPQTFSIQFLLRQHLFYGNEPALRQALLSLDRMVEGGIYDQLGGGFARYSTDAEWLAPHFEKMLYDNALLVNVLAEALQLTGDSRYERAIRETLAFIDREMTSPEGGFFSALDADSEGVEGKFYTWSEGEIGEALGDDAPLFCEYYDVTGHGNWEHTNILRTLKPAHLFSAEKGLDLSFFEQKMAENREKLLKIREKRIRPQLDDKVLLGWNAMMNTALSKAYAACGDDLYKSAAVKNMSFLEDAFFREGKWFHTWKAGRASVPAFLDDLACLVQALIHLQEITGRGGYLLKAKAVMETIISGYSEAETGFFFYTHSAQDDVIMRKKEVYDGATPSGNALMVQNLLYLSVVFDIPEWKKRAEKLMLSMENAIIKHPGSFGVWAAAVQLSTKGFVEIAIAGQHAQQFLGPVLRRLLPNKIVQAQETNTGNFPLLAGKTAGRSGETAFYLCKDYACREPFFTVESLLANV